MVEDIFDTVLDMEYEDLDINDKTILESQFNATRHTYMQLLDDYKTTLAKMSKEEKNMADIKRKIIEENGVNVRNLTNILNSDEEYITSQAKFNAYDRVVKVISEQLVYIKNDIRILQNSMFNRF